MEDWSHTTEIILDLTLEIIYLLTGKSVPPIKSGDQVSIALRLPLSVTSEGSTKQEILHVIYKLLQLLTGLYSPEECPNLGHKDFKKDVAVVENRPPLTSLDGSSNRSPPERCPGPLYSRDYVQEDPTIPHHYQNENLIMQVDVKEEKQEPNVRIDQQTTEEGELTRTVKQEESSMRIDTDGFSNRNPPERCTDPLYSRNCIQADHNYARYQVKDRTNKRIGNKDKAKTHQQSVEEGGMLETVKMEEETHMRVVQTSPDNHQKRRTIKEEEEETRVSGDLQSIERGEMMRTTKEEEEETPVRGDLQSIERGGTVRTTKEEEEETCVRGDLQTTERGEIRTTKEEEEETPVRGDLQSIERGGTVRTTKEEEEETCVRGDLQSLENGRTLRTTQDKEEQTRARGDLQSVESSETARTTSEEEKETYGSRDLQSVERSRTVRTTQEEEEETHARGDLKSVESGETVRTANEEEEEMDVREDQQSVEDGETMESFTEEEEETYLREDLQSTEDGQAMRTVTEEEESYVREDLQFWGEDEMEISRKEKDMYVKNNLQPMEEDESMLSVQDENSNQDIRTEDYQFSLLMLQDEMSKQKRLAYKIPFKLKVVKYAKKHGNRAAERHFGRPPTEKMIREWRKQEDQLLKLDKGKHTFRGHAAKWPQLELDMKDWVKCLRSDGLSVSSKMIRYEAKRIAAERGIQDFTGSPSWCHRFLRRCDLGVRTNNKNVQKVPIEYDTKILSFQKCVTDARRKKNFEISEIGAMDETPLTFELPSIRTVDVKGVKTLVHEKAHYTVVLSCCADGTKLSPMLILKRKNLPKEELPQDVVVHVQENGCMDQRGMRVWVEKVWSKRPGGLLKKPSLLVLGQLRAHISESTKKRFKAVKTHLAVIPGGLSNQLQPLNISINKRFKVLMREEWEKWISGGKPDLTSTGRMKRPAVAQVCEWVITSWNSVKDETVVESFTQCGISNTLDITEDGNVHEGSEESDISDCDMSDSEQSSSISSDTSDEDYLGY